MYKIEKVWKDWKIVRLIGEGSFGKVYEIVRNNFGIEEHSALKVITIPTSTAEIQSFRNEGMDENSVTEYYRGLVKDFVQEIALMSKLKGNPGIVAYEDYAVLQHSDDVGWDILIRMELLKPFPELMRSHNFSESEVVDLGISMCEALSICHKNNIIHRDIKLDNIFISDNGYYKLGDFGVARTIEKTSSGLSKKGTYTYMAPEVYRGESYGQNVDVYSLGMVMYRLLNFNREPFLPLPPENIKYNDKNEALVKRMQGQQFGPPANASEKLSEVIMKACLFDPKSRYSTIDEMKQELEKIKFYFIKIKSNPDVSSNDLVQEFNNICDEKTQSAFGSERFEQSPSPKAGSDISHEKLETTQSVFGSERFEPSLSPKTESVNNYNDLDSTQSAFGSERFASSPNPNVSSNTKNNSNRLSNDEGSLLKDDQHSKKEKSFTNNSKQEKEINVKGGLAIAIGWLGVLFSILLAGVLFPITIIQSVVLLIGMILFSAKKYSLVLWIVMLIASIGSFSILNLISVFMLNKECFNK